jgi:hypothetical protein
MPEESAQMALTQTEIEVLDQLIKDREKAESASPLTRYLVKLAQLGGYLARSVIRRREMLLCGVAYVA